MQIFTWDEIQIFTFFHVMVRVTSFIVFLVLEGVIIYSYFTLLNLIR